MHTFALWKWIEKEKSLQWVKRIKNECLYKKGCGRSCSRVVWERERVSLDMAQIFVADVYQWYGFTQRAAQQKRTESKWKKKHGWKEKEGGEEQTAKGANIEYTHYVCTHRRHAPNDAVMFVDGFSCLPLYLFPIEMRSSLVFVLISIGVPLQRFFDDSIKMDTGFAKRKTKKPIANGIRSNSNTGSERHINHKIDEEQRDQEWWKSPCLCMYWWGEIKREKNGKLEKKTTATTTNVQCTNTENREWK